MKLLKNSILLLATAGRGSPIGSSRRFSCPVGETADTVRFIHGKRADQ